MRTPLTAAQHRALAALVAAVDGDPFGRDKSARDLGSVSSVTRALRGMPSTLVRARYTLATGEAYYRPTAAARRLVAAPLA